MPIDRVSGLDPARGAANLRSRRHDRRNLVETGSLVLTAGMGKRPSLGG